MAVLTRQDEAKNIAGFMDAVKVKASGENLGEFLKALFFEFEGHPSWRDEAMQAGIASGVVIPCEHSQMPDTDIALFAAAFARVLRGEVSATPESSQGAACEERQQ